MHAESSYLVIILPLCLLLGVPVRLFIKKTKAPIPEKIFMLAAALLIGLTIGMVESLRNCTDIFNLTPLNTLYAFLPIFTMSTIYQMDRFIFLRCLPQVIIMVLFNVMFSPFLLAIFLSYFLHPDISFLKGMIIAVTTIPVQPTRIIKIFRQLAEHKHLATILEAESVLVLIPSYLVFHILIGVQFDILTKWYQVVIVILRQLVGGFIVGCIMGKMKTRFICWLYNEPVGAICISISMLYFTLLISECMFYVSGLMAITCSSCIVAMEKHRFPTEVDAAMRCFWGTFVHMADIGILMVLTIRLTISAVDSFNVLQLYGTIMFYFSAFFVRLISFLIIGPLIRRMTYNINLKCLLVLSWGNVKGCINLNIFLLIFADPANGNLSDYALEFLVYLIISVAVNTTTMKMLLRFIGFSDMSPTRLANMNNCIKYIVEKRSTIINILKMDRYLSNANWNKVRQETRIRHPYKANKILTDYDALVDDDGVAFWENDNAILCPDCHNVVPYDITDKEMADMLIETRLKVLRTKKVSIIKQYRNGTIDKNCLQILIHHLDAMIESNQEDNNIQLQNYMKPNPVLCSIRCIVLNWLKQYNFTPPTTFISRLCFYTTMHMGYDFAMFVVILSNALLTICSTQCFSSHTMIVFHSAMWTVFFLEFLVKLIGFSDQLLLISGMKHYFGIYWNTFDFILLIDGMLNFCFITEANIFDWLIYHSIVTFRTMSIIRLAHILQLINIFYPHLIKAINSHMDNKICFVFDLATSLINCNTELIDNLVQIIGMKKLRDIFRIELIAERESLFKLMESIQKESPNIAITVKTKQVIRTTLTNMDETLAQLKVSGFLDKIEFSIINKHLIDKQAFLRNLKFVQPSSPRVIFKEVPWMADDEMLIEFLYKYVQTMTWDAGEVIIKYGEHSGGIYIVVTGMLRMKYHPSSDCFTQRKDFSCVPIVDYLDVVDYSQNCEGTFISGSTFGELCVLTGRSYDCSVSAESPSQAYFLSKDVLKEAMMMHANPVTGLEARMWKCAVCNLAVAIMMDAPVYRNQTQEQIKLKLERSFMPNIKCYKMFVITELMDDVVLIEGVVGDYSTGELFKAPMLIPRTTHKLVLPKSSLLSTVDRVAARLLIVPMGNSKDLSIMENEEEIAELVSQPSSKCLLHSERITAQRKQQQHPPPILGKPSDNMLEYIWSEDKEIINLNSQEDVNRMSHVSLASKFSNISERRHSAFLLRSKPIYSSMSTTERSYETDSSNQDMSQYK